VSSNIQTVKYKVTDSDRDEIEKLFKSIDGIIKANASHPAVSAILYEDIYSRVIISKVITNKQEVRPVKIDTQDASILVMPTMHDSGDEPAIIWSHEFK